MDKAMIAKLWSVVDKRHAFFGLVIGGLLVSDSVGILSVWWWVVVLVLNVLYVSIPEKS